MNILAFILVFWLVMFNILNEKKKGFEQCCIISISIQGMETIFLAVKNLTQMANLKLLCLSVLRNSEWPNFGRLVFTLLT